MSYLRQPYPNELYHHGIKGQKWGVRRFQNEDGSLTPAGRERYDVQGPIKPATENDSKNNKKVNVDDEHKRKRKQNIKAFAISMGVASAVTLGVVVALSPELRDKIANAPSRALGLMMKKKTDAEYAAAKVDPETGLRLIRVKKTPAEECARVNPLYYANGSDEFTHNCPQCSLAFEMRRRGYEVQAAPNFVGESGDSFFNKVFETKPQRSVIVESPLRTAFSKVFPENEGFTSDEINSFIDKLDRDSEDYRKLSTKVTKEYANVKESNGLANKKVVEGFFSAMSKEPKDSRGSLCCLWGRWTGGHAMSYEVDSKGNPIVYDPQSGRTFSTFEEIKELLSHAISLEYYRLDDLELDIQACKENILRRDNIHLDPNLQRAMEYLKKG